MQTTKPVEYKNLLVNLKTNNFKNQKKKSNKKIKELEDEDKKLKNETNKKIKELEDEIKKLKLDQQVKLPNRNRL